MEKWIEELAKKIKKPKKRDLNSFMKVNLWLWKYYTKNNDNSSATKMDLINGFMNSLPEPNPFVRKKKSEK